MNHTIRTALLTSLPLLIIGASAQATAIYDFGTSTTSTSCGGSNGACVGGMGGTLVAKTGSTSGTAQFYTSTTEAYTEPSRTGSVDILWNGTGTGTVPTSIPVSWNFSINDVATDAVFHWDLTVTLDGATIFDSTTYYGSAQTSSSATGSTSAAVPLAIQGTAMGAYSVDLHVSFGDSLNYGGSTVTLSMPQSGGGVELGSTSPEPATLGFAGCGLLIAFAIAARRSRRPAAANQSA